MTEKKWDMYNYIVESKEATRSIFENKDKILKNAVDYYLTRPVKQLYIVGSGTSYHAGLAAQSLLEKVLGIPVIARYPMEFKDQEYFPQEDTMVIGISHAGRSTSTILALDKAKEQRFLTIAASAEKNRPIYEHAECTLDISIGPEYAGPKTKGYVGTIATLVLFGLEVAKRQNNITQAEYDSYVSNMLATTDNIPNLAETAIKWYELNKDELMAARRIIIVGYEECKSAMMEGTLKVLEAVRYSVTGYEQEEFMHGVYHSIDENTYMIYLGSKGQYYPRMLNMKKYFDFERDSKNYLITWDEQQANDKKNLVFPFQNDRYFASMEYVVPLQVLARKLSTDLGIDCNISSDPDFHKKMGSYTY